MSRGVEPKKVAPLIRGARYSFLIAGWLYGESKKTVYTKIEAVEAPKRKAAAEEERKLNAILNRENDIREIKNIFQSLDVEPEPGWEKVV